MKNIKRFKEFINENLFDYDYDFIRDEMKSKHGWGDAVMDNIEDFEKSNYYDLPKDDNEYVNQFNIYMTDLQYGRI